MDYHTNYLVIEAEEMQAEIAEQVRLEGTTAAAFGDTPESKDPGYLDGFFAEMRRRVEAGEHLEIRWLSESFRTGAYDAPDWFNSGEQEF